MTDRAILFANGELRNPQALRSMLEPTDYLVAVDGGVYAMRRLGLEPDLLVGDLDSVAEADLASLYAAGCEVRRFPPEKDETDLELALRITVEKGFTRLHILAALGGRLDQMLGNIFLLSNPAWAGLDVRVVDAGLEAWIIRDSSWVEGRSGDTLSLLPLNGAAQGVWTDGLAYPLVGETLHPESTRGISNRMLYSRAQVRLQSGILLCIHLKRPDGEERK